MYRYHIIMYEHILICILIIVNFVSVFLLISKKDFLLKNKHDKDLQFSKCANLERCTQLGWYFTYKPKRKSKKIYLSWAWNIWVSGYVHHLYKFSLSVCLFVCLFVSNKRQNGWTHRAQILCRTSRDPREGL